MWSLLLGCYCLQIPKEFPVTGLEKVSFSFQSQRKAMPKNVQIIAQLYSSHMLASESESCSVMSDSLRPHGLYSPGNFLGQNTGVGSLSLLQGTFPTQRLNPGLPHCRQILYQLSHSSAQFSLSGMSDSLRPNEPQHARPPYVVHHHSWSPPKLMSIELVMPSNHLILCRPLLLTPSIFPSIRVFSNESVLRIRWPKHWSFSFNISLSNEHPGLISFRMDWLELLAVQGTLKSLLQHHISKASILQCSAFFVVNSNIHT